MTSTRIHEEPPRHAFEQTHWWPLARLGEALELLARDSGLSRGASQPLGAPPTDAEDTAAEARRWVDWAGRQLGIEVVPVDAAVPELPALLRGAGPAVLPYEDARGIGFFLLARPRRGQACLLAPDGRRQRVPLAALREAMCRHREAPHEAEIATLLDAAAVPAPRRAAVRAVLMQERLATERVGPCWMLRLSAGAGFAHQLREARLPRRLGVALALFAVLYGMEIAGWGLIGHAALEGRFDIGWLVAWLLLLLSMVPLQLAGGWLQSTFALDVGRLLKSRLLAGALRLDVDAVRRLGVGQWLGRVIESQALESLALGGGLAVGVSLLELGFAAWVLSLGAAPAWHLALLAAWLAVTGALGGAYLRRLRAWTAQRLQLTHELIEGMVGHRTRLAQERPGRRDAQEDQSLHTYLQASQAMDRVAVPVFAGLPAGWLWLALAALAPAFVGGVDLAPASLAVSLGGVLLAQRAFGGITGGLASLARAAVAWQQVRELFRAGFAERPAPGTSNSATMSGMPGTSAAAGSMVAAGAAAAMQPFVPARTWQAQASRTPLVDATGLAFGYRADGQRVLAGADLRIAHGERLLLEGPSGGGKSTLASLLTGLRQPQSGLLLLNGLDRPTLGDDWHQLATSAPQFHENHVFSGTLAFNLLMGRAWPASEADLQLATSLCRALGLGELLERMPAGLMQRVGETGWQLSHGERSRIFLARALLQGAPLTVMDESFAALDPETLERCLRTALQCAPTLMVIAHP